MKTFYSSTFLTVILAFLALLGKSGTSVVPFSDGPMPSFQTIIEPIGPFLPVEEQGKVKVEIFNTFGCSSCNTFGQSVLPRLVEKYAENDLVDLRLFLIPDRESEAELYAARGAHCAARHGSFWDMINKLHKAETLNKREVDLLAQELELPLLEFRKCLDSEDFDPQTGEEIAYSEMLKINQKPTILVNDTILLGAQPIENIEKIIMKYQSHLPALRQE